MKTQESEADTGGMKKDGGRWWVGVIGIVRHFMVDRHQGDLCRKNLVVNGAWLITSISEHVLFIRKERGCFFGGYVWQNIESCLSPKRLVFHNYFI